MTTVRYNAPQILSRMVQALDLTSSDPEQFMPLQVELAKVLELGPEEIHAVVASGSPMIVPLLNDTLPSRRCRLLVVVVTTAAESESTAQTLAQYLGHTRRVDAAAIVSMSSYGDWFIPSVICRGSDSVGARIKDTLSPSAQIVTPASGPAATTRGPANSVSGPSLVMDDRVMRMAKLAIASSSAVIFVGPPGTGKTTIVRELLQEVAYNPAAFGLSRAPREPKWVTPSENWTSIDLVGGEVTDNDGRRRFHLGHVLEAIRQDRWLVLDEANRADMDRIFGGLLTWLSDQKVELGRAAGDLTSPPVTLEWNDRPESHTVRLELLDANKIVTSDPIRFRAGHDWRILGTYNAQDASRVFVFGQALGRRFTRVPVPVIEPSEFRKALAPLVKDMPAEVAKAMLGLYTAHRRSPITQLGPAIFLHCASYVAAGLKLKNLSGATVIKSRSGGSDAQPELVMQLVSEAYLTSAGAWLAGLEPEALSNLGKAVIASGFPESEWEWVKMMVPTLG